jgi:hypothetical protein
LLLVLYTHTVTPFLLQDTLLDPEAEPKSSRHLVDSHTCGQEICGCRLRTGCSIFVEDWKLANFQGQQHARLSGLKVVINIILGFK